MPNHHVSLANVFVRNLLVICWLLRLADNPCPAKDYHVSSAEAIARVAQRVRPGDTVVMADGVWTNQVIVFQAQGTAQKPIRLRASSPGGVVLTGESSLEIEGEHLVVSGLAFRQGRAATNGIFLAGRHCRLTETAVLDSTYRFFVHIAGVENRMDHCYLAGKTSDAPTLQIEVADQPNRHRIDHNHFGPRPPLGRNGGETIRVGYSWQSMSNSVTLVENNLFDRCDGELEIISSKSCGNIYRNNTFLDCAGTLTLRHGNGCLVENNYFLAHHKRGSGGIRVIGEDHTIINNYIDGVDMNGIWVTAGIPDSPLRGYFQARNILIAFNTIVDCRGPCLDVSAGLGSAGRTLRPERVTIANNLFCLPSARPVLRGQQGDRWQWIGNLAFFEGAETVSNHYGIRFVNEAMQRGHDGLWRPGPKNPARGGAQGVFEALAEDIEGQPRRVPLDVGADQNSRAQVLNRPLSPANTGPAWLRRTAGDSPRTEKAP